MEDIKTKVYLFYKDDDLCGFTERKDIASQYHSERPQCKMKVKKFNETKWKSFRYFYQNKELFQNVMDDKELTIYPITSYEENDRLDNQLNQMVYLIEDILQKLDDIPIQKEVKDLIRNILSCYASGTRYNFDIIKVYLRYIANY